MSERGNDANALHFAVGGDGEQDLTANSFATGTSESFLYGDAMLAHDIMNEAKTMAMESLGGPITMNVGQDPLSFNAPPSMSQPSSPGTILFSNTTSLEFVSSASSKTSSAPARTAVAQAPGCHNTCLNSEN